MLEGKKIIVTGCGRGMGEATFLAYVRAGAKVVGMDIDQGTGQQAADAACALVQDACLLYTSPSPRDATLSRMPSSA